MNSGLSGSICALGHNSRRRARASGALEHEPQIVPRLGWCGIRRLAFSNLPRGPGTADSWCKPAPGCCARDQTSRRPRRRASGSLSLRVLCLLDKLVGAVVLRAGACRSRPSSCAVTRSAARRGAPGLRHTAETRHHECSHRRLLSGGEGQVRDGDVAFHSSVAPPGLRRPARCLARGCRSGCEIVEEQRELLH